MRSPHDLALVPLDDRAWPLLAAHLRAGRHAAALLWGDERPDRAQLVLDDQVSFEVRYRIDPHDDEQVAVVPASGFGTLYETAVELVDVRAPTKPRRTFVQALALVSINGTRTGLSVVDRRGIGRWGGSAAPVDTGSTVGEWVLNTVQTSGVPAVNKRRRAAVKELRRQQGNAGALVDAIRYVEIVETYQEEAPGAGSAFRLFGPGTVLARSPEPVSGKRAADRIVDALSREAYGATRPKHRRARQWAGPRFEDEQGVSYEELADSGDNPLVSEFALQAARGDSVGHLASALADGTGGFVEMIGLYEPDAVGAHVAHGDACGPDCELRPAVLGWSTPGQSTAEALARFGAGRLGLAEDEETARLRRLNAERRDELTTFGGLTAAQAQAVAFADSGLSGRQIAARLGLSPSTVSRTLARARAKLAAKV